MLQKFKNLFNFKYLICVFLTILPLAHSNESETLIVSYMTAHLNQLQNGVQGILVTPSGDILKTVTMGPYGVEKIVINNPEEGSYSTYFQALMEIRPKYCYVVGGIDAHLCSQPSVLIPFTPADSHVQGFTQSKTIRIGDTTLPIASFQLNVNSP